LLLLEPAQTLSVLEAGLSLAHALGIESLAALEMATPWHVHHREDELMMRSLHIQMSVKYNPISFKLRGVGSDTMVVRRSNKG